MLSYLMFLIAFALILISMYREGVFNNGVSNKITNGYDMVMFAFVLSLILGGGLSAIPQTIVRGCRIGATKFNEKVMYQNIISATNDSKVSGSFFIGCGSINQIEYYMYFKRFDDGGIKRGMIPVSNAIVYENDEVTPRVEWNSTSYKVHWSVRMGLDILDIYNDVQDGEYRLIVPVGTVIQKFDIK